MSNIDRDDIEAAIAHHRLPLDTIVTSEDVGAYKPDGAPFRAGLAALGIDTAEALHVGDSLSSDVAGANALGIRVAWINPAGRTPPESARIDYELADLRELLPLVSTRAGRD